jgi:hypothetical protein
MFRRHMYFENQMTRSFLKGNDKGEPICSQPLLA